MILNNIYIQLETKLTLDKIKKDFIDYMEYNEDGFVSLSSYDYDNYDEKKMMSIHKTDELNILNIKIQKKYLNDIYLPLFVHLSIGSIKISQIKNIDLEKCFAEMIYNEDFELIDIDFYHCKGGYA